jgi:hypothetical protein
MPFLVEHYQPENEKKTCPRQDKRFVAGFHYLHKKGAGANAKKAEPLSRIFTAGAINILPQKGTIVMNGKYKIVSYSRKSKVAQFGLD